MAAPSQPVKKPEINIAVKGSTHEMTAVIGGKTYEIEVIYFDAAGKVQFTNKTVQEDAALTQMRLLAQKTCTLLQDRGLLTESRSSLELGRPEKDKAELVLRVNNKAENPNILGSGVDPAKVFAEFEKSKATTTPIHDFDTPIQPIVGDGNCGPNAFCHQLRKFANPGPNQTREQVVKSELILGLMTLKNRGKKTSKYKNEDLQQLESHTLLRYIAAEAILYRANKFRNNTKKAKVKQITPLVQEVIKCFRNDIDTANTISIWGQEGPLKNYKREDIKKLLDQQIKTNSDMRTILKCRAEFLKCDRAWVTEDFFKACSIAFKKPYALVQQCSSEKGLSISYLELGEKFPKANETVFLFSNAATVYATGTHFETFKNDPKGQLLEERLIQAYKDEELQKFLGVLQQNNASGLIPHLRHVQQVYPEAYDAISRLVNQGKVDGDRIDVNALKDPKAGSFAENSPERTFLNACIGLELTLTKIKAAAAVPPPALPVQ